MSEKYPGDQFFSWGQGSEHAPWFSAYSRTEHLKAEKEHARLAKLWDTVARRERAKGWLSASHREQVAMHHRFAMVAHHNAAESLKKTGGGAGPGHAQLPDDGNGVSWHIQRYPDGWHLTRWTERTKRNFMAWPHSDGSVTFKPATVPDRARYWAIGIIQTWEGGAVSLADRKHGTIRVGLLGHI